MAASWTTRPRHHAVEASSVVPALLVLAAGGVGALLAYLMEWGSYDTFAAIPVAIGLVLVSIPLLRRASALEVDKRIAQLLWIVLPVKLVSSLVRYAVTFGLYDGQ